MEYILHRVNNVLDLENKVLNTNLGAEIDVRYHENELILEHDPFFHHEHRADLFKNYLLSWGQHSGTLIVNLKTEGIELKCKELLDTYNIKNWFFLDMSPPILVQYMKGLKGKSLDPKNLCLRYSEYEPLPAVYPNEVKWIWVDCFSEYPDLGNTEIENLRLQGVKLCLVSPELQGHLGDEQLRLIKSVNPNHYDAVCTKSPKLWQEY